MRLLLYHPAVAARDCDHCQKFVYDEDTGEVRTRLVTNLQTGNDEEVPLERPEGTFPPCQMPGMECPKGSPTAGVALSEKNWRAYAHFQRCRAVGRFPEDSIVERNAGIIDACLRAFEDSQKRIAIEYLRIWATRPTTPL